MDCHKSIVIPDEYSQYQEKLSIMLTPFKTICDGHLEQILTVRYRADLSWPKVHSLHSVAYRSWLKTLDFKMLEVENVLELNVLEPAQIMLASTADIAWKTNGTLRYFVDYRKRTAISIRDLCLLARRDECIESLWDRKLFATIWRQTEAIEKLKWTYDHEKTAFSSHQELYRSISMPSALKHALVAFQRVMDIILPSILWKFVLVYFYNIVALSPILCKQIEHCLLAFGLLQEAHVTLMLENCFFFTNRKDCHHHLISSGRLEVARHTIDDISDLKTSPIQLEQRYLLVIAVCSEGSSRSLRVEQWLWSLCFKNKKRSTWENKWPRSDSTVILPRKTHFPTSSCSKGRSPLEPWLRRLWSTDRVCFHTKKVGISNRPIGSWSKYLSVRNGSFDDSHAKCLTVVWIIPLLRPYL